MHQQVIYFGAPGTGKSHYVKEKLKATSSKKIFRVTIHPEYTYTDFIGQLLPEENPSTGSVEFLFKEGPFTRALIEAFSDNSTDVFLILEEISRGNVAAIFGDIFQLLDRDKYFVSKYPIRSKNIADKILQLNTDEIFLPSNFNIIGTVNINDQNVFPMDTAFKRRFEWIYVPTNPAVDANGNIITNLNNPSISVAVDNNRINDLKTTWQSFYSALNIFITDKEKGLGKSEDKQLGQFFIEFGDILIANSHSTTPSIESKAKTEIENIVKNKLLLYLWQDVQGNSSFNTSVRMFAKNIRSFDDLYNKYGNDKVFSDIFIDEFLRPNLLRYPY